MVANGHNGLSVYFHAILIVSKAHMIWRFSEEIAISPCKEVGTGRQHEFFCWGES